MFPQQIVRGPVAPLQVQGPIGYYPSQTTTTTSGSDWTDIINSFMPLIMMVAMMGMMIPLMKNMGGASS
jgi:hypothetical protein